MAEGVWTLSMHCESNFPFRKEASHTDVALPDHTDDRQVSAAWPSARGPARVALPAWPCGALQVGRVVAASIRERKRREGGRAAP